VNTGEYDSRHIQTGKKFLTIRLLNFYFNSGLYGIDIANTQKTVKMNKPALPLKLTNNLLFEITAVSLTLHEKSL